MRFLLLEPFFGGSHQEFAQGLKEHSSHEIELLTLPARFWKWRMRGAALEMFRRVGNPGAWDGIIASSMLSLSDYLALAGETAPPALFYVHESQFDYPLAPGETLDIQYCFTNIVSATCASRVLFNSRYHLESFLNGLDRVLARMPDARPTWIKTAIASRAAVLYPGCRLSDRSGRQRRQGQELPLVVWNHRWEHDKNPAAFFDALTQVRDSGISFRLAVLGESYSRAPACFDEARMRFSDEIACFGHVESRQEYLSWLGRADVVVSTAVQENFGMAVVEAVAMGAFPLLPNRLSYPEIIPEGIHDQVLYQDEADLVRKLSAVLSDIQAFSGLRHDLSEHMAGYSWPRLIHLYDRELTRLAGCRKRQRVSDSQAPDNSDERAGQRV